MALASTTDWELRTGGSDNSGGGYNIARSASATDRSQSDSAYKSGTNLTVDATTNTDVAPDGYTPDATADPGNIVQITTTGTGAAFTVGFYEIVSVVSGKWRLDRSPAAVNSAGATWAMGGALISLSKLGAVAVAGNTIWVKSGTYSITSATQNGVAGGRTNFNFQGGSTPRCFVVEGYQTTRGDKAARPIFDVTLNLGSSNDLISTGGNDFHFINLEITCNAFTINNGFNVSGQGCHVILCKTTGTNMTGSGIRNTNNGSIDRCYCKNNIKAITAQAGCLVIDCYAEGGGSFAGIAATRAQIVRCISVNGMELASGGSYVENCTITGRTISVDASTSLNIIIRDVLVVNVTGFAVTFTNAQSYAGQGAIIKNLYHYNCSSGAYDTTKILTANVTNTVALANNPLVDSSSSADFSVNNNGQASKFLQYTYLATTTNTYVSAGAVQPKEQPKVSVG
jgi:hypothetical protein